MDSRNIFRTGGLLWPLFVLLIVVVGCSTEDDQVLGPAGGDGDEAEEVFAWLWAFDADEDSLRVYDADTGTLHATFFAQPHPTIREVMGGPEGRPTVWMGSDGTGFAFTAGFPTHGDHAHMEVPEELGTVVTGAGNTHLSADAHGETVCWANDGDQTFTVVDTETLTPTTVSHGSPHSACVVDEGVLLATHMQDNWARLIDIQSDALLAEIPIDTQAHGEAYYHDAAQVFLPCLGGFDIIGIEEQDKLGSIAYPHDGRVNFLFYGHDSDRALAPVKLAAGNAAEVWILDMEHQEVDDVPIAGSALAWNRSGGQISVSNDGSTAVLTDLESPLAYVVDVATGTYQSLTIEEEAMPCATDHSGRHIWLLDEHGGEIHFWHLHEGYWEEGTGFDVHPGSDWIFVTSLDPGVGIIRDY